MDDGISEGSCIFTSNIELCALCGLVPAVSDLVGSEWIRSVSMNCSLNVLKYLLLVEYSTNTSLQPNMDVGFTTMSRSFSWGNHGEKPCFSTSFCMFTPSTPKIRRHIKKPQSKTCPVTMSPGRTNSPDSWASVVSIILGLWSGSWDIIKVTKRGALASVPVVYRICIYYMIILPCMALQPDNTR